MLVKQQMIADGLGPDSLFASKLVVLDRTDSTNNQLKRLAREENAPEGTVLVTGYQSEGRGTHGRSFFSPEGGLYLSVLLRPKVPLAELLTLTGWAAVAVRQGIAQACGAPLEIKWLNDIYLNGRKLCGILTELSPLKGDGTADYVIVGVGVNVSQTGEDFRSHGLEDIAVSLSMAGFTVTRERLCVCILRSLERMYRVFPQAKEDYLEEYRANCLTVGRAVRFEVGGVRYGTARGVGEDFSLTVTERTGETHQVSSGTVTLL